jgi:BMFP domain-containing protein YqiC
LSDAKLATNVIIIKGGSQKFIALIVDGYIMTNTRIIDEITRKVYDILPQGVRQLQEDLKRNVQAVIASTLERMDLVTREEFDVQTAVLARTREKLERLEKQVAELEHAAASGGPKPAGESTDEPTP